MSIFKFLKKAKEGKREISALKDGKARWIWVGGKRFLRRAKIGRRELESEG